MTAKEYLRQAYLLDQRIDSRIEQLHSLKELALKCTSVVTGMPHSPNKGESRLEDTVTKIVDLQTEINRDIDRLVDLKRDIVQVIGEVDNPVYQALLEKRYLSFMSWEQLAGEMSISVVYAFKLHKRALAQVKIPEKTENV